MSPQLIRHFRFFHEHAGYIVGQSAICAVTLARAALRAADDGHSFHWSIDPSIDSSDFSDQEPAWQLWQCAMRSADESEGQRGILASLHGIDFGRDGAPWSDPYRRVVEAELASEHYDRLLK